MEASTINATLDGDPPRALFGYPPQRCWPRCPRESTRFEGRVVWISTAGTFYSILGVSPGTTLATAGGLLRLIGRSTWA